VYRINQLLYSARAESLVYLAEDAGHERDFWVVGADFRKPRQITQVNPQLNRYAMGPSRLIEWRDLDGKTIRGALLLPVGYEEGKRYPLIVSVYGGGGLSLNVNCFGLNPNSSYAPENKQLFATRGFAVLSPDAPLGVGTPMRDLMKTVLPGINKAIDLGIADPDRLGLMGVSYGGYSTLALIAQTTRFKAAMMTAGFGDLVGISGEMEKEGASLGAVLLRERWWTGGRMPGSLWESRQAYVENSPVFYLDRVQTPLLIVHGGSDTNVAPFLSDEIYVFLRSLGKEVVYAKYEGEGHATLVGYANQIDFCNRMIGWFESHLATNTGS
jgi:dipeptidyl aminopeptidase/acylaminoacyl peptidase